MKLVITTPIAVAVEALEVAHVRATDATGCFGIQSRHADFITALEVSVVSWRSSDGRERYAAVRGGVLCAAADQVTIASREVVVHEDLAALESTVLEGMRATERSERQARATQLRLELGAMRLMHRYLHAGTPPDHGLGGAP